MLKLEQQRGCDNKSVYGGLDGFLEQWQASGNGEREAKPLRASNLLPVSYGAMSQQERSRWVLTALSALGVEASAEGTPAAKTEPKAPEPVAKSLSVDLPASVLRSVTSRVSAPLKRLDLKTVGDILYLFPRRHNRVVKVAELQINEEHSVVASLWASPSHPRRGHPLKIVEADFVDETGTIHVVWFNQPYMAKNLKSDARYILSGRVTTFNGRRTLNAPHLELVNTGDSLEKLTEHGRLFPVYPLSEGITQQSMRKIVREALGRAASSVKDGLPIELLERNGFLRLERALWQAHYPDTSSSYEAARRRIAFEELFMLQLGVLSLRRISDLVETAVPLSPPHGVMDLFLDSLPFTLTGAQKRVLNEVMADMARDKRPMSRLLQGEVGSGKTVIALAALLTAAACGFQGAIMAPTEVLAEQHFLTVGRLLEELVMPTLRGHLLSVRLDSHPQPISVGLLLSSTPAKAKREIHQMLAAGALDVVIGTHAVIQENVEIPNLALAVVDEQHRFGVMQRAALREQGRRPHMLVMSATPIPRTLALTLYGDLDLSTIDELPPGRQPIKTKAVGPERRSSVYDFVRKEIASGRQAFFIYPLIDESEVINARAAVKERDRLAQEVFPDLRVGLLHGRMSTGEKKEAMDAFRHGSLDILVSTPVVEVGIDVPNATVMVIEGADRFGLAQLHQFRGRVGRGEHASYCVLVAESPSEEAKERLAAMEEIDDGFKLAEKDLKQRGPGDYFGTRQSGLPDLRMARLDDTDLLSLARQEAETLLDRDPTLSQHPELRESLTQSTFAGGGEAG